MKKLLPQKFSSIIQKVGIPILSETQHNQMVEYLKKYIIILSIGWMVAPFIMRNPGTNSVGWPGLITSLSSLSCYLYFFICVRNDKLIIPRLGIPIAFVISITILIAFSGGTHDIALAGYMGAIMTAGLLLGSVGMIFIFFLSFAGFALVWYLEKLQILDTMVSLRTGSPLQLVYFIIIFGLVSTAFYVFLKTMKWDLASVKKSEEKALVALQNLRENEAHFKTITEHIRDTIWSYDTNYKTSYVSPSVQYINGFTGEESASMGLKNLLTFQSYNLLREKSSLMSEVLTEKPVSPPPTFVVDLQLRCKDGSTIWAESLGSATFSNTGEFLGISLVLRVKEKDKIEGLMKEKALAEANVRAAEMMIGLEDARDDAHTKNVELLEVNQLKSSFLSSMSHELRTPLNAIMGFNDLLHGQAFGILNKKQQHYVEHIRVSSTHLLDLISDLLDIAKIDSGTTEMTVVRCSTEECIDGVVSIMGPQIQEAGLTVEVNIEKNIDYIFADSRKLTQILMNLLSNAIKHTPKKGSIQITLQRQEEGFILFSVQDSGSGIPAEEQEMIFSEFHQVDKNNTKGIDGIGLGLALARRLVELHGGRMGVKSAIDRGSTFWFTLPVNSIEEEELLSLEEKVSLCIPPNLRILMVDDVQENLDMLTDMLSVKGYPLAVAINGEQVIDMTKSFKPDIILMDIRMPVMDGLEATKAIRALPEFFDLPIIALTANATLANQEECFEAGCTAHLSKPITSQSLFTAIVGVVTG